MPADRPSLEDILVHPWMLESCEPLGKQLSKTSVPCSAAAETSDRLKSAVEDVTDLRTRLERMTVDETSVTDRYCDCVDTVAVSSAPQRLLGAVQLCAESSTDRCVELCPESSTDRCVELCAESSADRCVELCAESSTDRCVELCAESSTDRCVELCAESSADRCVELCAESSTDRCVELCAESSTDRCLELSADLSCEKTVELYAKAALSSDIVVERLSVDDDSTRTVCPSATGRSQTVELCASSSSSSVTELKVSDAGSGRDGCCVDRSTVVSRPHVSDSNVVTDDSTAVSVLCQSDDRLSAHSVKPS